MTKFLDILCRNSLTGETSQFGSIDQATKEALQELIEGKKSSDQSHFVFHFEEFIFAASANLEYIDSESKKRTIRYNRTEVQDYCMDLAQFIREQTRIFINYSHDIQYLIHSLNANSYIKKHENSDLEAYKQRLESINLISIVISAKNTFFRYLTEDLENSEIEQVSITDKVFKIYKGIPAFIDADKKTVEADFKSSTKRNVNMINIFEFIPYTIVENIIKYGPQDLHIDFEIYDNNEKIFVDISSLGPTLDQGEQDKIFERGFRGRAVEEAGFPGHGLGLFQANQAASELFRGKISIRQDCDRSILLNGMNYCQTTFTISIPL